MITKRINITCRHCLIGIIMFSCVQVDDFDTPGFEAEELSISSNSDIKAVKSAYEQSGKRIYTFDSNDETIIEGFVISSDEAGSFYKVLVIQDNYENPTSGIEVLIDLKSYYTKYNFGRKIFIQMAGLSVSNDEGKYKIGYNSRNDVENIPAHLLDEFIIRSTQTKIIVPKPITLENFSENGLNNFVQISNIQFKDDEIGRTFGGEKFDEFNGDRILVQCDNQLSTTLSTSTFSDFKSNLIPIKKGKIEAVLTKDFYAEKYVLILNNLSNIVFTEEKRCDPDYLNCNLESLSGSKIIFFENFQEINKTKELESLGWTNENLYLGNETYNKRSSQGNVSMQISAYDTAETPLEVWLITPAINLENSNNEILTFDTKATYDNGTILTVWASTNLESNIIDATWQQLDVEVSVGPSNSFDNDFVSSGNVSLNCLSGNVHIAFRYQGGDPGITTTYDIDNIKIMGY